MEIKVIYNVMAKLSMIKDEGKIFPEWGYNFAIFDLSTRWR
jgi:hypothetical protein